MCGLGGIAGAVANGPHLADRLARLLDALRHRGPDGDGTFIDEAAAAGLVHARLAILDPSSAGRQPMADPTGRFRIVLNGEIYNFRELRAACEAQGDRFVSQSDTEVLLALFAREGTTCVRRLRGMYAFAIWDTVARRLVIARDPLGIKPLYVAERDGEIVFGSELRAVLAVTPGARRADPAAVLDVLRAGSVREPRTLVAGVRMVPAGTVLEWDVAHGAIERTWWRVGDLRASIASAASELEATAVARDALRGSVHAHLVSDVPVGLFLSGGMDSTAILAFASEAQHGDRRTFTIGFESSRPDERERSAAIAAHFGTTHEAWRIGADEGRALFATYLEAIDQPTIDGFNVWCVSKLARDHGVKVVLSGIGGDELFGGYPSIRTIQRMRRWSRALGAIGLRTLAARGLRRRRRLALRRLGEYFAGPDTLERAHGAFRGIREEREAVRIGRALGVEGVVDEGGSNNDESDVEGVVRLDAERYLRNQLLRDADVMSMAWGIELRTPFVDRVLWERVTAIPASFRLEPGKRLLSRAVPGIPREVWDRPKDAFLVPFEEWLERSWRGVFAEADEMLGPAPHRWYERFSLAVLLAWCRRHDVALGPS